MRSASGQCRRFAQRNVVYTDVRPSFSNKSPGVLRVQHALVEWANVCINWPREATCVRGVFDTYFTKLEFSAQICYTYSNYKSKTS